MANTNRSTAPSEDKLDLRSCYWVARGIPVVVDGKRIHNFPLQERADFDLEITRRACAEWRTIYPDVKIVEGRPL